MKESKSDRHYTSANQSLMLKTIKNLLNFFDYLKPIRLDFDSIAKKTGFVKSEEDTSFVKWVKIFLNEMNQKNLRGWQKFFIQRDATRIFKSRVCIKNWFKAHSETSKIVFNQPVFITGYYRTGTTLLYNLLSQDSTAKAPHLWELYWPGERSKKNLGRMDPRIKKAKTFANLLTWLNPDILRTHPLSLEFPEECGALLANAGFLPEPYLWMDANHYGKLVLEAPIEEQQEVYKDFYRQMQVIHFGEENKRWVSKNPMHSLFLVALLDIFSDAIIIETHRDPIETLGSACSLHAINKSLFFDKVDKHEIGQKVYSLFLEKLKRTEEARSIYQNNIIDIKYHDLVKDPLGTVKGIYNSIGIPYSTQFEEAMIKVIAENPQHKHGVHKYKLEDYGLDPEEIRETTKSYRQKYINK